MEEFGDVTNDKLKPNDGNYLRIKKDNNNCQAEFFLRNVH